MNLDTKLIAQTELFRGIAENDAAAMLNCLQAYTKAYPKGSLICREGEPVAAACLLLSGEVHIEQGDFWGNRSILSAIMPGDLFSEAYACLPGTPSMVDAVAAKDCEVLFLNVSRTLRTCPSACLFHARLIQNLLADLAAKSLRLTRKIAHTTPKSIRARVLAYLSFEARRQGRQRFDIPFSRQQLADYLCVERSALSNELSKMRADGLIDFHKNTFQLKSGAV